MGKLSLPAMFSFKCFNTRFDVAVVPGDEEGSKLAVQADLGSLPYSAESAWARQHIKAMVKVGENLPYAEISMSSKKQIIIRGTMEFEKHPPPAVIVASSAVLAIAIKPFIELIGFFRDVAKTAA